MKFYIRKWFEDYQMYLKDWGCKTTNWLIFDPPIHPFVFLTNEYFFLTIEYFFYVVWSETQTGFEMYESILKTKF